MRLHSDDFEVSEDSNTREIERSEMGGGDPAGLAGGAGGNALRGIDERSEALGGGAGGNAPRGINAPRFEPPARPHGVD